MEIWILLAYTHTVSHTRTHTLSRSRRVTYSMCRLQLHSLLLSPPLSIHHALPLPFSFILPHPLTALSSRSLCHFFQLSLLCSLISPPLTFKPTSAFALYPSLPHLSSLLSLPIFSIYLKFPSACPSACFTVLSIYLSLRLLLIFHF